MSIRRNLIVTAAFAVAAQVAVGAVVLVTDDNAGWAESTAVPPNLAWTTVFIDNDPDVWGSGTAGVSFSGPVTQGQAGPFDDYITESTDLIGNLTALGTYGASSASFSFYNDSSSYQPAELSLYFSDGTYEWYQDLALPSQGWTGYTASLNWGSGTTWYDASGNGGGSGDFATSLTTVTELGIRILYDNDVTVAQQYGLSGFQLFEVDPGAVPEPGTYVMLSTVLMSLGFTFGRKKKEAVTA